VAIALGNGAAASAEMPRALAAPPIPRSIPWRRTLSTLALAALLLLLLHQLEEGLGLHARGVEFLAVELSAGAARRPLGAARPGGSAGGPVPGADGRRDRPGQSAAGGHLRLEFLWLWRSIGSASAGSGSD